MNTTPKKSISLLALISIALIIIGARLHIIDVLAVEIPYWDDWGMGGYLYRHLSGELGWLDYFAPTNTHRMVFARMLTVGLFEINQQQWDPMISMVVNTLIWTVTALFLIHFANKNSHRINAHLFCFLILMLWTFPISLVNTLWGIQSHNYIMILFAVLGCWYIGQPALTLKWWLGAFCLFGACLTLAGGSFVGVSVAGVYTILTFIYKERRRDFALTAITAALAGAFGLWLILIQPKGSSSFELIASAMTFSKSMSWPTNSWVWPCLIYAVPLLVLIKHMLSKKAEDTKLARFTICIYGFVILVCLGIAIARPMNGIGPSRRYFEFLSLAFIASSLALLFIQNIKLRLPTIANSLLILTWLALFFSAIPIQLSAITSTLDDRQKVRPPQYKNVMAFINTQNIEHLNHKEFRHIPFHRADFLAKTIKELQEADMLPYQLQLPPHVTHDQVSDKETIAKSPFIHNGTYIPNSGQTGQGYRDNLAIGSYKNSGAENENGMKAVGNFTSAIFAVNRPYAMIPITGHTGAVGMSLKMVNELTKEEFIVKPKEVSYKYAEVWREHFMRVPNGYYRLVAQDNRADLWFGFGSPRPVGRLSYFAQTLMNNGYLIWQIGCLLLLISVRKFLVNTVSSSPTKNNR